MEQEKFEQMQESYVENPMDNKIVSKSKVKITKNRNGTNIEIQVVTGESHLLDELREEAIKQYRLLKKQLEVIDKQELKEVQSKSV